MTSFLDIFVQAPNGHNMKTKQNKTKQNKTKQNKITLSSLVSAFQLVRPTIFILCVSLFSSLSSFAFPPPTLPNNYYTVAYLGPDAKEKMKLITTYQPAFWQVNFDSQLNGCKDAIKFVAWITVTGTREDGQIFNPTTFPMYSNEWTNNYQLTVQAIKQKALITNVPGDFWVSHMMFQIEVNGTPTSLEIYPTTGWQTYSLPGLPYPCNCISILFNKTTHTLEVVPGACG